MDPIIATPLAGTRLRVVGDTMRVLATSAETGGAYEMFEMTAPRDSGPPAHAHPWSEAYVVIEGEADGWVGGERIDARPGCFIQIPAGTKHGYRIRSESAKFVIVTSPGGASGFFTELDAETGGSCEDMEKVAGIAVKHGFTV